jgi:hypothetical protein
MTQSSKPPETVLDSIFGLEHSHCRLSPLLQIIKFNLDDGEVVMETTREDCTQDDLLSRFGNYYLVDLFSGDPQQTVVVLAPEAYQVACATEPQLLRDLQFKYEGRINDIERSAIYAFARYMVGRV